MGKQKNERINTHNFLVVKWDSIHFVILVSQCTIIRLVCNANRKIIEDKFEKRLSCWKGKLLSYGGPLVLINSVLSSLAIFMLSFFEIPKGILYKLNFYRSRLFFFWQGDDHKKKYRLTKWSIICRPKEQGGLGILDLEI